MEYHIHLTATPIDIGAIEQALQRFDPAGLADLDADGRTVRLSTIVLELELLFIMEQAGHRIRPSQIERMPSVCCGGCSG